MGSLILPDEFVAVDGGARLGLAVFRARRLVEARTVDFGPLPRLFELAVVELPDHLKRGGVADVALCAFRSGAAGAWLATRIESIPVSRWKGSLKKETCAAIVRAALDPAELAVLSGADHHAADAVGLGLYALGRFSRYRPTRKPKDHDTDHR